MGHHRSVDAPGVDVSVIVPAYRAEATLDRCVGAVLRGCGAHRIEVLVAVSDDDRSDPPAFDDPRVRVLWQEGRCPAAAARNRAAAQSRGATLAFVDADVIVDSGWLDRLLAASDGGRRIVAGAVRNGTPSSPWGTVEYLVQFLDLAPTRPAGSATHGATCNLLVPRELWDVYGPMPEDLGGGEDTILTLAAAADGRFAFAHDAVVTHLNRETAGAVLAHQREFGRFTARLSTVCPQLPHGWLQRRAVLAPVAVVARIVSVATRALAWKPVSAPRLVAVFPLVALALLSWGLGLAGESARLQLARRAARRARRT